MCDVALGLVGYKEGVQPAVPTLGAGSVLIARAGLDGVQVGVVKCELLGRGFISILPSCFV